MNYKIWYSRAELAERFNKSVSSIYKMTSAKKGPPYTPSLGYHIDDIIKFEKEQRDANRHDLSE